MMRWLGPVAIAVMTTSCSGVQSALNPAGLHARSIASLAWLFFSVCLAVYVLVIGAAIWAVVRRRNPSDDSPETSRRIGRVIAGAVMVTIVTLVGLIVVDAFTDRELAVPNRPDAVVVEVIGHQWWWEFRYKDASPDRWITSPNELHIPVGVPIIIEATSRDVNHSFWVPNLHGKRDLIPGFTTRTWLQADVPGIYRGQCAEFCGHQHANMAFLVVAEPRDQFQAWYEHQRSAAAEPSGDEQRRGRDVFMQRPCVMCHAIRGTDAGSRIGPDLTHLAGRRTIAAGTLPMTRDHLSSWVTDPQAIKPGNRMPPNPLSQEDLSALVAYLETLR